MSFDLKKLLEGAVAQVNPFDGGKTYASVMKSSKPTPPPASTARPRQSDFGQGIQQIGGLLSGLGKNPIIHGAANVGDSLLGNVGHLADTINYGVQGNTNPFFDTYKSLRDKGQINDQTYSQLLNDAAQKAGYNMRDQGATVLRKTAGAVAMPTATALTAGAAPEALGALKGLSFGAKVARSALPAAGVGAGFGAITTLGQQDPITWQDAASNIGGGALLGGLTGAAGPIVGTALQKGAKAARGLGEGGFLDYGALTPTQRGAAVQDTQAQIADLRNQIDIRRNAIDEAKLNINSNPTLSPQQKDALLRKTVDGHQQAIHDAQVEMGGFVDHLSKLDPSITPRTRTGPLGVAMPNETTQAQVIDKSTGLGTAAAKALFGKGSKAVRVGPNSTVLNASPDEIVGTALGQGLRKAVDAPGKLFKGLGQEGTADLGAEIGVKTSPAKTKPNDTTTEYIKQLTRAQDDARKGESKGKVSSFLDEVKRKFIDSNAPIEDVLNAAQKNGAKIAAKDNVSYQIDKALRAPTLAGQFVKDHGLSSAIQNAPDVKAFNQYLIARHAQDLTVKGIKTGRDAAADAKLLNELKPKYEAHAKTVTKYSRDLLDYAVSKGLVSKELAKSLKAEYPNYVPMNRIFGENELPTPKGNGRGTASVSGQTVVQKLKGSERQIENPLESLLAKTNDAFQQGERNDAARMLASYRKLDGNPFRLRELKHSEAIGNKNVISYLDKGKKRVFETTPEIAAAAKSLNKEQLGLVGKILSVPTRVLRLGATGINLPFIASNVVRDQVSAFINSDRAIATSIANPANFTKALFNALGEGKEYENLIRAGAGGNSYDIGRNAAKETVNQIRADRSTTTNALYNVTHPAALLRAVEDFVGKSENLGRIQQFTGTRDALLKEGKSKADADILAAHAARNNSTNFARAGDYGRVLNSVLPYLNAGVQGSRTLVRNLKNRPAETGAKIAVTTFMPVAAVTAWNLADPQRKAAYDNILESEKGGNIIIVPPNPTKDDKGRWNVIKIPLSQEIANLADVVRNGVEAVGGSKSFDIGKMAANLLGTATSLQFNEPRQLVGQLVPQAIKPAVEGLTNTNLYSGVPIVPQSLQNYPAGMQYKPGTSGTAVQLGKTLGISPLEIENAVGTAGGGVGRQLLNASDHALAGAGVIDPSQIGGQDALDTASAKFTKARGVSEASAAYQQKLDAAKAKAAAGAPKKLVEAGLESGVSAKSEASAAPTGSKTLDAANKRVEKVTKNLPAGISKTSADTLKSYAKLSAEGRAKFNANPTNKFKLDQAQYEQDKANGKLSAVEDYKKRQTLSREGVTSQYSDEVKEFYGMSKAQQKAFFASDPEKAKELYAQAKQLDSQLGANKYKYGLSTKAKAARNGNKYDFAKSISSAFKVSQSNTSALRKLVKGSKIKRKTIKA